MAVPSVGELEAFVAGASGLWEALGLAAPPAAFTLEPLARGEYHLNYLLGVGEASASSRPGAPSRDDAQTRPGAPAPPAPRPAGPWVLRVNLGSQMGLENQIGYEMEALELLAPSGRTPKAYWWDGSRAVVPWGVGVEEYLPGRPLDYDRDLDEAAAILADVHAVPLEGCPTLIAPADGCVVEAPGRGTADASGAHRPSHCPLIAPADPLGAMVDECQAMAAVYRAWDGADPSVLAALGTMERRSRELVDGGVALLAEKDRHPVNTELNSGNFLMVEEGRSHLVDWEKPLAADVAQDLAHFLVPTTTFWKTDVILDPGQWRGFLDSYRRAVAGRFDLAGLEERLGAYATVTCFRGVSWCAMAQAQDAQGIRSVADDATRAKVAVYLEDPFLSMVLERWY